MALLTFEGFEAYNTPLESAQSLNTTFVGTGSGVTVSISTAQARTGARSLNVGQTSSNNLDPGFWRRGFTRSGNTIIVGAAYRFSTTTFDTRMRRLLHFSDSTNGVNEIGFGLTQGGSLVVGRGLLSEVSGTVLLQFSTTLATSVDLEPLNTWVYYELKVLLDHTANGSYTLRRNGQVVLTGSNVQTVSAANININAVTLRGHSSTNYIDDLYVCDGSGSTNNDFLGQVRVAALRPESNLSVGWTPNTGANWDAVNDTTPDDDTTYVSASTAGLTDLYDMTNLPGTAAVVRAIMVQYRARLDNPGAVDMRAVIRSGPTNAEGGDDAQDATYRYYQTIWETNPDTNAAWTTSAVNALKAGVKRQT